jgi:hypothetical protein
VARWVVSILAVVLAASCGSALEQDCSPNGALSDVARLSSDIANELISFSSRFTETVPDQTGFTVDEWASTMQPSLDRARGKLAELDAIRTRSRDVSDQIAGLSDSFGTVIDDAELEIRAVIAFDSNMVLEAADHTTDDMKAVANRIAALPALCGH